MNFCRRTGFSVRGAQVDVVQPRNGAVRGNIPVGSSQRGGIHKRSSFRRTGIRPPHWASRCSETVIPGLLAVFRGQQKLARFPVENVVETIPVRPQHHLSQAAFDFQVGQDRSDGGVPIVDVMRNELVVPLQLTAIRVERDD